MSEFKEYIIYLKTDLGINSGYARKVLSKPDEIMSINWQDFVGDLHRVDERLGKTIFTKITDLTCGEIYNNNKFSTKDPRQKLLRDLFEEMGTQQFQLKDYM
jgi:hypothetical protein